MQNNFAFISPEATKKPTIEGRCRIKIFDITIQEDAEEYEQLLNNCLTGEFICRYEEKHWTKDGDFKICISWIEVEDDT